MPPLPPKPKTGPLAKRVLLTATIGSMGVLGCTEKPPRIGPPPEGPPPPIRTYPCRFEASVMDERNVLLSNVDVKVTVDGEERLLKTDADGHFALEAPGNAHVEATPVVPGAQNSVQPAVLPCDTPHRIVVKVAAPPTPPPVRIGPPPPPRIGPPPPPRIGPPPPPEKVPVDQVPIRIGPPKRMQPKRIGPPPRKGSQGFIVPHGVLRSPDGALAGVPVELVIDGHRRVVTTGAEGDFALEGIAHREARTLTVRADGFLVATCAIDVEDAMVITLAPRDDAASG